MRSYKPLRDGVFKPQNGVCHFTPNVTEAREKTSRDISKQCYENSNYFTEYLASYYQFRATGNSFQLVV